MYACATAGPILRTSTVAARTPRTETTVKSSALIVRFLLPVKAGNVALECVDCKIRRGSRHSCLGCNQGKPAITRTSHWEKWLIARGGIRLTDLSPRSGRPGNIEFDGSWLRHIDAEFVVG